MQFRFGSGLLLLVLLSACTPDDRSPFALWEMRAGMNMTELDSLSQIQQKVRFECSDGPESFRICRVATNGAKGELEAVVAADGRVVRMTFTPDLDAMQGANEPAGLVLATESLREQWSRVVDGTPAAEGSVRRERWTSTDRRWSGQIVWDGDIVYPARITVADEQASHEWEIAQQRADTEQLAKAAAAPVTVDERRADPNLLLNLMKIELRQLVSAQKVYHEFRKDYQTDLAALQYQPRPRITVEVGAANPLGFWARATHTDLTESCVVWWGRVPRPPAGLGPIEGEPSCT